jgi:hypothetical protein
MRKAWYMPKKEDKGAKEMREPKAARKAQRKIREGACLANIPKGAGEARSGSKSISVTSDHQPGWTVSNLFVV